MEKFKKRQIITTGFIVLTIFGFILTYNYSYKNTNNPSQNIVKILQNTPYLWRRFNLPIIRNKNIIIERMHAQQQWMQQLSQSDYIKHAKARYKNLYPFNKKHTKIVT